MLDAARLVQQWVTGKDQDSFEQDYLLQSAVLYQIPIIGEAASRVSREFRAAHAEISRRDIIGMRQVVVHDYPRVDMKLVWHAATLRVPELARQLMTILPPEQWQPPPQKKEGT